MRKIVGIIGYPIGHSISPAMHNAAFQALKLDYEYVPFEVNLLDLKEAVTGLRALHVAGFNVTIPHKETIIPLLDEVTKLARTIGAVNTVENQEGKLVGYNTDGPGFIESLAEDAGFDPKNKEVVVLGAGGASRAVSTMLAEVGARNITIADIVEEKARNLSGYLDCRFVKINGTDMQKALDRADLLVNTSPVGMHPKTGESPLSENIKFHKELTVYDVIYNPSETKLLKSAKAAGCRTISGLGMLIRQGALAFTVFTGEEAPIEIMWSAAENALHLG